MAGCSPVFTCFMFSVLRWDVCECNPVRRPWILQMVLVLWICYWGRWDLQGEVALL